MTVICNSLPYFVAHKLPLFETPGEEFRGDLFCGEPTPDAVLTARAAGFAFRPLPLSRYSHFSAGDVKAIKLLRSHLRERTPLIAVSITLKANLLSVLALATLPRKQRDARLVLFAPGLGRVFDDNRKDYLHAARRAVLAAILRLGLGRIRHEVIFENPDDRDQWVRRGIVRHEKTHVLKGTGISVPPLVKQKEDEIFKVVFASRLLGAKGVREFLAAARLIEARNDIRFIIYGGASADEADGITLEPGDLPSNVDFRGEAEGAEVMAELARADCVCLPSRYMEGLPRILLEGAAMECALIATNIRGCREIVRDGQTGVLIAPAPPEVVARALADAITMLADTPCLARQYGRNARRVIVEEGYDIASVRGEFQAILKAAMTDGSRESP